MNFLAHAYLSFGEEEILIGNFIGDFVKGSSLHTYSAGIQNGIFLHREIDRYTDFHPLVKEGQTYLRPYFGHYSTVITDIYFDYFLSLYWKNFSSLSLESFASNTYKTLFLKEEILPEKFVQVLIWMKNQNWLLNYGTHSGIEQAFKGLARRAKFDSKMEEAPRFLGEKEREFKEIFFAFFEELKIFAKGKLQEIQESHVGH